MTDLIDREELRKRLFYNEDLGWADILDAMPSATCGTCDWWKGAVGGDMRGCTRLSLFATPSNFGCNQWEAK